MLLSGFTNTSLVMDLEFVERLWMRLRIIDLLMRIWACLISEEEATNSRKRAPYFHSTFHQKFRFSIFICTKDAFRMHDLTFDGNCFQLDTIQKQKANSFLAKWISNSVISLSWKVLFKESGEKINKELILKITMEGTISIQNQQRL